VTAQAVLPGCSATPTVVESDLRGDVAIAIMAFLSFAEMYRGGARVVLDGAIADWITIGKPADPQISRALLKLRSMLARYVDRGGVPSWFPPSLLAALGEPWCAAELAPTAQSNLPKTETETRNQKEITP
jgi:hypothetical protein